MVPTTSQTGREELAEILALAARQDGPIRLLAPKGTKPNRIPSLFASSRGRHGFLLEQIVGTFLKPVLNRPRMVILTRSGIERLIKNTPQNHRPQLVEQSSPLYRVALLEAWKKVATRGEETLISGTVQKLYGPLLTGGTSSEAVSTGGATAQKNDLTEFRELLAQEVAESWKNSASEEAKNRLGHILKLLGAEPLGVPGEVLSFTGLQHVPLEPLFKGDPAKIVRPGWVFPKTPTPLLLTKAEVLPAE